MCDEDEGGGIPFGLGCEGLAAPCCCEPSAPPAKEEWFGDGADATLLPVLRCEFPKLSAAKCCM